MVKVNNDDCSVSVATGVALDSIVLTGIVCKCVGVCLAGFTGNLCPPTLEASSALLKVPTSQPPSALGAGLPSDNFCVGTLLLPKIDSYRKG